MSLLVIIVSLFLLVFLLYFFLNIYAIRKNSKNVFSFSNIEERISIVISIKNEEDNIKTLISNLKKINYSIDNYEVILVDDSSTDKSLKILLHETKECLNYKVVEAKEKKHIGKKGAVRFGIENSKYDIIALTDADCIVPDNWLKEINKHIKKRNFACGISPFFQTNKLINKISCYENFKSSLLNIFFYSAGLKFIFPARNIAYRKDTFLKIGGFNKIDKNLGGDDSLLIDKSAKLGLSFNLMLSKDSFVYSYSKEMLKDYLKQRSRHVNTAHYLGFTLKFQFFFWHIINLSVTFLFLLNPLNYLYYLPLIIKTAAEILVIKVFQQRYNYNFSIIESIYLSIVYEIMLIINFFNSFRVKRW